MQNTFHISGFKKESQSSVNLPVPRGAYRRAGDFLQEQEAREQEGMASNWKSVALH